MNSTIMGLFAQTSLAAGTGQNLGVIDLPIMREAPTGYPVVFGSALKGAMRAKTESSEDTKPLANEIFGDDDKGGSKYAGALVVGDAKLLLLPVRSMTTHFKWVTCPYLIDRFKRDLQMCSKPCGFGSVSIEEFDAAVVPNDGNEGALYLEEFAIKCEKTDLSKLIEAISALMGEDKSRLSRQLTVVSDDMFNHLSQFATPVNAHIAIDSATKIVKNGALWYEETLPPETLLYSVLLSNGSRKSESNGLNLPDKVMERTKAIFHDSYIQIGGNETVGMGWCKVVFNG